MKKVKLTLLIITLIVCIASLTACSTAEQYFVYGTTLDVTVEGFVASKKITAIQEYMTSLESILSPTAWGSDLYKINNAKAGEAVECNTVTMEIMQICEQVYDLSNGAYDASVYPLVRLWNFSGDTFTLGSEKDIPTSEQIQNALALVGLKKAFSVDYDRGTITKLIDGAMLDFGGVAKGYATQKSLEMTDGKVLVNLGGNIGAKGKNYNVGIANPQRTDRTFTTAYFAKFSLNDGECVSTSGDYERYYTASDGNIYHHIINPKTGYPQDTSKDDSVISCTVISKDGALADALATAVVVLGAKDGVKLLEKANVKALIIKSDLTYQVVGNLSVEIKK